MDESRLEPNFRDISDGFGYDLSIAFFTANNHLLKPLSIALVCNMCHYTSNQMTFKFKPQIYPVCDICTYIHDVTHISIYTQSCSPGKEQPGELSCSGMGGAM